MKPPRSRKAFTLVELLVATSISLLMLTLLGIIAQNVLRNFQTTQKDLIARRDAEFALDVLIPDLEAMVVPRGTNAEAFRAVVEDVNGSRMAWITLLTSATDKDSGNLSGVPRAVSYRVAYQDTISPGGPDLSYALYRAIAGAGETFASAMNTTNLQTGFWSGAGRPTADLGDYVVGNVLDFRVSFLLVNSTNWVNLLNVNDVLTISSDVTVLRNGGGSQVLADGVASLEVMLTVVTTQGADLLKQGAITREQAVAKYGRSFTRRTSILNRPR